MFLKDFQQDYINKLLETTKDFINEKENHKIIFESPTGSGKTIMMAEFLKQIIAKKISKKKVCFIWMTPRKTLATQSKKKLEKYYSESKIINCVFLNNLKKNEIPENNLLAINWESINKKNNIFIEENEEEFNLSKILENTKLDGLNTILILDESHHTATSDISKKLIKDIDAKLTIEVSATPILENPDAIVKVPLIKVKKAGLIKKNIELNKLSNNKLENSRFNSDLSNGDQLFVLKKALEKRKEIFESYKSINKKINPLLLIQLPDVRTEQEKKLSSDLIKILKEKYKITIENEKLAIWLSGFKRNCKDIEKNNHKSEVIILKNAPALGWDCPRASVLALFRNWKSFRFSIQTVGRIMRMPEPKFGHYKKEILNNAYVYTNLENISIEQEIGKNYITIFTSERKHNIKLYSMSRVRQREKTRLNPNFIKFFLDESKKYNLHKKIKIKNQVAELKFIINEKKESVDDLPLGIVKGRKRYLVSNEEQLQREFDYFVRDNLTPFYPEDRSIGRVKRSIYEFFKKTFKINFENKSSQSDIIKIVLSENNKKHFVFIIDLAKEQYISSTKIRKDEFNKIPNWNLPESISFTGNYSKWNVKKSAMQPFYYDGKYKTEMNFINFMEKSKKVLWWFKNGEGDQTYFSLPYKDGNQISLFYIDFIVMFKNKSVGLFDTKSGWTIDSSKNKSDGLQQYISKFKKQRLWGGIVTNSDNKEFRGRWIYFKNKGKNLSKKNFDNWDNLII